MTLWQLFKILVPITFCVVVVVYIAKKAIPAVDLFGNMVHTFRMARKERIAKEVEIRRAQLVQFSRDDRGFTGIVFDDQGGMFTDLDTGRRWEADAPASSGDPDSISVINEMLKLAAMSGIKAPAKMIQQVVEGEPPEMETGNWLRGPQRPEDVEA